MSEQQNQQAPAQSEMQSSTSATDQPGSAEPSGTEPPATNSGVGGGNPTSADASAAAASSAPSSAPTPSTESAAAADPNAGALAAESQSDGGAALSAGNASPGLVTEVVTGSESLLDRAEKPLLALRQHLWSFERSAVSHLHAALDEIEKLLK